MHFHPHYGRSSRRPINPHKPKNLTQTHKGFRNEYGILPSSFLEPQNKELLAGVTTGFAHVFFICRQEHMPKEFSNDTPAAQMHFLSSEHFFVRDEERPEEGIILDLLDTESTGFSLPIGNYNDEIQPALAHGGKMLRRTIDELTDVIGVRRYPQRIICCGSHLLCTLWLRSVIRSQQKECVAGRNNEFVQPISMIESHAPENGLLRISTTTHALSRRINRFIVSDAEMPR